MSANMICATCGGKLVRKNNDIYKCQNCTGEQSVRDWGDEAERLLEKALDFRMCHRYDMAYRAYCKVLEKNSQCIDALWGALLSKYGVEISGRTKFKPSLHKLSKNSFLEEPYYKKLENLCNAEMAIEYEEKAKAIERTRQMALKAIEKEPDYDIFLSFKTTDENGNGTKDKKKAEEIYQKLTKLGYRVFYAPKVLEGKSGLQYEPIIYAALHSSEAMVLISSKDEYINSPWVANEWKRYVELINENAGSDNQLNLFVCHYGELQRDNLPEELQIYQTIDFDEKSIDFLIGNISNNKEISASIKETKRNIKKSKKASKKHMSARARKKLVMIPTIIVLCIALLGGLGFGGYVLFKPIPVENIVITSKTTIGISEEVTLTADITPAKSRLIFSKDRPLTFKISGENNTGATITDGVFCAPLAGSVYIAASSDGVDSEPVKIDVVYVGLQSIAINCATEFKVTQTLDLSVIYTPSNATSKNVIYQIVEEGTTAAGATVTDGKLLATGVGVINLKAVSDDDSVESPIKTVTVLKEPVAFVQNTNAKNGYYAKETVTQTFNTADLAATGWIASGSGATYRNDAGYTGSFRLRFAGSSADASYFYKSITLNSEDMLSIDFYLYGDSYVDDVYVKLSNDNGISWVTACSLGAAPYQSWKKFGGTVQASVLEGNNRNVWLAIFCKLRNPTNALYVDDITYSTNSPCSSFKAGSSLTLTSTVAPDNATFNEVTYEIVSAGTTAAGASVNGNILTATGVGIIKLRPKADGVYGEEFIVSVT